MSNTIAHHPSSYRDPSGFIFERNGMLYRQVNISFKEHFDHFIQRGCYDQLVKKRLLIPHENIPGNITGGKDHYATIKPERIEFISYPYEWSFDMVRDAALLTLQVVRETLPFGMMLKDASPYNIQWHKGGFVFIDTLSFEKYEEVPWIAYRQFCENFLGPLLIMHYSKKHLPGLMLAWPNGIPLATIKSLLPKSSRFSLHVYLHIHLHVKYSQKKNEYPGITRRLPKKKLLNLITSLEALIRQLKTPSAKSEWSDYYGEASQRNDYLEQKRKIIETWINEMKDIQRAADLGANEGEFSKLLARKNIDTIAADLDPCCINDLYLQIKSNGEKNIQPLIIDLSNPTPATGVNNKERYSFIDRAGTHLVLALALVHHLAIGQNIPFEMIAAMFSQIAKKLVIEFIPKEDDKIKLMLSRKRDIYSNYDETNFVNSFEKYYAVNDRQVIPGTGRVLYLMQKHE